MDCYGGASRADLLQTSYCAARKLGSRFSTNRPTNNCSITPTTDETTSGESEPIAQTPPGTNERLFSQLLRLIILFITAPQRWNTSGAPSGYKPLVSAPYSVDDDGIMVVGAINQYAGSANPFTPASPAVEATDPPTSCGRCVDIWAPGDAIWSTWGANPPTGYSNGTYSNMARLSGTSMASPHVAAAAAYIADVEGLTTPAAVEQRIRQLGVQFGGTVDQGGFPIKVLQLP